MTHYIDSFLSISLHSEERFPILIWSEKEMENISVPDHNPVFQNMFWISRYVQARVRKQAFQKDLKLIAVL